MRALRHLLMALCLFAGSTALAGAQISEKNQATGVQMPLVQGTNGRGSGQPLVEVTLNKTVHATFMIDTGTGNSMISEAVAKELGLHPEPYKDASGKIVKWEGKPVPLVNVMSFAVTDMRVKKEIPLADSIDLVVVPPKRVRNGLPEKVEGIIGMNLLSRFILMIDPPSRTVSLMTAPELNFQTLSDLQMDGAVPQPLVDRGDGILTASVRLNNKVDLPMTLDTGACVSIVPQTTADDLKLQSVGDGLQMDTMQGHVNISQVMMERMALGPADVDFVPIYATGAMKGANKALGLDKTLGMDFLTHFRVLVDGPGKKLYLKRYTAPAPAK